MISSERIIGKNRIHYNEIDSTNVEAKRLIEKGAADEGLVITADYQTNGKGQYGRSWESGEHLNVTMSIIVAPLFLKSNEQFVLNIGVSLAVASVVSVYCGEVTVKWPNDIYVGEKKIAGILIQNFLQGDSIRNSIVGIGLNVLQADWAREVTNATSLSLASGKPIDRLQVIDLICEQVDRYYKRMQLDPAALVLEYESILFGKGEPRKFIKEGALFEGVIQGVDEIGRLIIKEEEQSNSYNHGDISFVI